MSTTARSPERFAGTRVLVTSADFYMGPAVTRRFEAAGAEVVADTGRYVDDAEEPAAVVERAGRVDVLVVNLSVDRDTVARAVTDTDEAFWQHMFAALVHPTRRFVTAVLPQMIERSAGKIVVVTSALPLRGVAHTSAYTAARSAQNGFVRAAGAEVARHNVQINAIAQNFVYGGFPEESRSDEKLQRLVQREVPIRRLAEGWEQAELVLFLASHDSDFFCGHVFPFAGGWVTSS